MTTDRIPGSGSVIKAAVVQEVKNKFQTYWTLRLELHDGRTLKYRKAFKQYVEALDAGHAWLESDRLGASLLFEGFGWEVDRPAT